MLLSNFWQHPLVETAGYFSVVVFMLSCFDGIIRNCHEI